MHIYPNIHERRIIELLIKDSTDNEVRLTAEEVCELQDVLQEVIRLNRDLYKPESTLNKDYPVEQPLKNKKL